MTRAGILLLALAACGNEWDPDDFPRARVHVEAAPERYVAWRDAVDQVTTIWNTRLAEYGCEPAFEIVPESTNAHPVRLVARADWEYDHLVGACWSDRIEVLDNSYSANTLAHEFGHAMGLGHYRGKDKQSIMGAAIVPIFDRDVRAAACMLGCGPCDTIDEYDEE